MVYDLPATSMRVMSCVSPGSLAMAGGQHARAWASSDDDDTQHDRSSRVALTMP